MNGLRQYMVAALLLLAWRRWANNIKSVKNNLILILEILLMSTFHKSILICIPLFFCADGKLFNKKVMTCIFGAISMAVVTPFYNFLFNFLLGSTDYAEYYETNSTMGISRFIICCFPFIMVFLYYYLYVKDGKKESRYIKLSFNAT